MVDETKNCVFEGALVWSKSEDYDAIWRPSKILDVGAMNEMSGKIEIQVELEDEKDGNHERVTIKTKLEDNKLDEYQHIKPRASIKLPDTSPISPSHLFNYDLPTLLIINEPEILERIRLCHSKQIRYLSIGPIFLFLHRFETIPSTFNSNIYRNYYLVDDIRHDILNPLAPHIAKLVIDIHLKVSQTTSSSSSITGGGGTGATTGGPVGGTTSSSAAFRSTQAIIMLGESGSGKSKCAKDICSHLAYLASTTTREDSIQTCYIPDVKLFESIHCILDSFGHAQTTRNPYSSRYSKAIKVSYDEDTGLIKGILYRCFHLETNRIVQQLNGESNYRVFYDVFDDIYFAAQATSKYGIDNLTMFRYTSQRPKSTFQPGKSSYKDLSAALEFVANLPKSKQNTSIFGLLAAILHLGELEFDVIDNYGDISTVLSADPASVDRQNRVLSLLGITIDSLYSAITKKNLNFAGNIVEKSLDHHEATIARDSFACQLYSSLFRWIVSKTNEGIAAKFPSNQRQADKASRLFQDPSPSASGGGAATGGGGGAPSPHNTFFLYDLTGFENIETQNGLEQLCINYSNERIFQFLNQIIFILDKELFFHENLFFSTTSSSSSSSFPFPSPSPSPSSPSAGGGGGGMNSFHDNSQTIRLLDNRSNGIFTICDDQLKLKSSTSDEKLANILYTQHGNNKNFIASKLEQKHYEFMIKHYSGTATATGTAGATTTTTTAAGGGATGGGVGGCQVKYNVLGFTGSNKLEPSMEILECLKSSTLSFIREEIYSCCDFKSLATASSQTGLNPSVDPVSMATAAAASSLRQSSSRNLLDRSPSGRNFFDKSPSSRNLLSARNSFDTSDQQQGTGQGGQGSPRRDQFLKQRSFAHSASGGVAGGGGSPLPGRGLMRAPSLAVRSSGNGLAGGASTPPSSRNLTTNKVATLASSCSAMMTEILMEAKLCDVTFFLCLKINDANDPLRFDQQTVLRQLKPYGIPNILSFYSSTSSSTLSLSSSCGGYPYRLDHISFLNRYCVLSQLYSKDHKISSDFMIALWECRSCGMENEMISKWQKLCHELIPLIPTSLPEMEPLIVMMSPSSSSSSVTTMTEQMVHHGIKIGELYVYLTAMAYSYLNALQRFALDLLKNKIWNFYKNLKMKSKQKAGVVIGTLMLKLLDRTRRTNEMKRRASIIAIQARVRCFIAHQRFKKARQQQQREREEEEALTPILVTRLDQGEGEEIIRGVSQSVDGEEEEEVSDGGGLMISFDFDDLSHNQLTHDVILEKVDCDDSLDLNRNGEGNVNLEDMSSRELESLDPTITTTTLDPHHLYARSKSYSISNDDNDEEGVAQVTNVDGILDDDGEGGDDASLEPIQVNSHHPHHSHSSPPVGQNLLHHFNADDEAGGNNNHNNSSSSSRSTHMNNNITTHSQSFHSSNSQFETSPAAPPALSLAQQTKITELQSKVDTLEAENSRLRRKLESLSSFVREEEKSPEPQTHTPATVSNPKRLASRMSSLHSQGVETSVYGGEFSRRSPDPSGGGNSRFEHRPDYEKYVQKTLETLDEDITYLLHGAPFYKFGRSGSVHKTLIFLSTDFRYLYWKPKNPLLKSINDCRIDLRLVWRLVPGQSTPPFLAYKGITHGPMPPKRSFSLIYGFRSLDLCALDDEEYNQWFIGLKYILQLINGELQEAGLDRQYLRKKWNYIDINNYGFLSRKEIIQLVSSLGISFDRTSFTTALLKSTIGNSSNDEITFSQFDSLVYQLRRRPDLEILWSKVIQGYDFSKDILPLQFHADYGAATALTTTPNGGGGGSGYLGDDDGQRPYDSSILQEVIGIQTFKNFWKLSQNRVLSDDEVKKMFSEGMKEMYQEDFPVLSYHGFVSIMTHYKNDVYDPLACVHSMKSMGGGHPLQHYYISCSDGRAVDIPRTSFEEEEEEDEEEEGDGEEGRDGETQRRGRGRYSNRPNSYVVALQNGCRGLELRCFEETINRQGEQTDLFVGNPRNKNERVTFKETILHIHRVAFANTHYPLLLFLELSGGVSMIQQKRAARLLMKLFGNTIFTSSEAQTKLLPSPLELKNRVLIFLTHRKRDIHTAYRVISTTSGEVSISPSRKGGAGGGGSGGISGVSGANDSFMSMKSNQSFDPDQKSHRHRPIIQQISESFDFVEEEGGEVVVVDDYDSESEYGLDPPINSISPKHRSHSRIPRRGGSRGAHYLALDPEAMAMGKNGTLDKSQMDLIQRCDVIHSSLMSLCHYSRGLRIGSHPLRDMLARLSDDPEAEDSLINFNLKRFTYIYMDQNTKKFGSYGGMVNAWDCGISMVSLCHDYPSLGTKINSGRFRQNGNCGFVLKPERYRQPTHKQQHQQQRSSEEEETAPLILTLHIISGKDLPIPNTQEGGGGGGGGYSSPYGKSNGLAHSPSTAGAGGGASGKRGRSYSRGYSEQENKSADSRIIRSENHDLNSIQAGGGGGSGGGGGGHGRSRTKGYSVVIDLNGGATCDDIQNKTRSIKRHGRSPYWNEVFTFPVNDPKIFSQGQLTLRIFYNDTICTCYVSIPLAHLRSGYRSVALYEEKEENNFISTRLPLGSLFVRVRFDEIAQYNNLHKSSPSPAPASASGNMKIMKTENHPKRVGSHLMMGGTSTTPPPHTQHTASASYHRSRSEGRGGRSHGSGGGGGSGGPKRTPSRSSSRGVLVSYDSTPILQEGGDGDQTSHHHEDTSHRHTQRPSGILEANGPLRVRSRRETGAAAAVRRKSETNYEVSEEMTNHYEVHAEDIQSSFSYQDVVIEAEKEQNAKKLSLKRLSQLTKQQQPQQQQENAPSQPPPPPPPPPPPRNQQQPAVAMVGGGEGTGGGGMPEENDEEYLPSYGSAVNLIELREQNARNIQKFDVDSAEEEEGTTSNRPSMDPWTPPV